MAKAELKTTETTASVDAFIAKQPADIAADCRAIMGLMRKATGEDPKLWGASISFSQALCLINVVRTASV